MIVERKDNSKVTYYIDEEKKTVVCKLEGCKKDVVDWAIQHNPFYYAYEFLTNGYKHQINDTYKAKATCHAEDTWDVEKGKRIALCKVLKKYYEAKDKVMDKIAKDFFDGYSKFSKKSKSFGTKAFLYHEELCRLTDTEDKL